MPKVKYELVLPDSERRKLIKTVKNGASTAKEILQTAALQKFVQDNI